MGRGASLSYKYLTQGANETIIHAFVSSRLDYCNSLLCGVHDCLIAKLQHAQNAAARVVTKAKLRTKITPVLQSLHWLPIRECIHLLLLTYMAVDGIAPAYLLDLVTKHAPSHRLRSGAQNLLKPPSTVPITLALMETGHLPKQHLSCGIQCRHLQITTEDIPFPKILWALDIF